jgi:hypothetical protein
VANYSVTLKDLPAVLLAKPKQLQATIVKALRLSAKTEALRLVQEEVSAAQPMPVDRGTYRRMWQARDIDEGVMVFNPTPYAAVIEHGRRPGGRQPPIKPLQSWVLRKGLVKSIKGKGNREKAAKGIAFAIARKIAKDGQPARHILAKAVMRWMPLLRASIKDAILAGANANKP